MQTENNYPADVQILTQNNKQYFIVGTAHISRKSADLVRKVIENEKPDNVCIELDEQRYKALSEKKKWESLDIKEVIKNKQLSTLLINILLASYQKKLGEKLGVEPGIELLEAAKVAQENNIPITLSDREVRITLRRAWNSMSFWQKFKFMSVGLASIFEKEEISEEKLAEIKDKDVLTEMMNELGKVMPILKRVLIDERDLYLAQKLMHAEGEKIVAVVGAGHVRGIIDHIERQTESDLKSIEIIPKSSTAIKVIGWAIPFIIIASIIYIGFDKGITEARYNAVFWILANGIPSAIGTVIAMGHPLTILSSFLAAPITSLSPLIGAGYVAAFVQTLLVPPVVKEFQTVSEDVGRLKKWWSNRLLRIILVFILCGLGSAVGTYVGAYEIISNLF
ncbi:MAG: TraB/GumN family protein [Melioribacteraceae bacterium]|nr:TraB/GumN family protein [Melioribacteraceae bacterium]